MQINKNKYYINIHTIISGCLEYPWISLNTFSCITSKSPPGAWYEKLTEAPPGDCPPMTSKRGFTFCTLSNGDWNLVASDGPNPGASLVERLAGRLVPYEKGLNCLVDRYTVGFVSQPWLATANSPDIRSKYNRIYMSPFWHCSCDHVMVHFPHNHEIV